MAASIPIIIEYGGYDYRERLRVVTFKIEPSKLEEVDRAALKLGLSRSELIRYALEKVVEEVLNGKATYKNPNH